jgi:hypothetical protein
MSDQMAPPTAKHLLAAMVIVAAFVGAASFQAVAETQRIVIVQDDSAPGASPAADQSAYRISIEVDDALRDAGFDVLSTVSLVREPLTPRIPQPEPRLAAALIIASVERQMHVLAVAVFFNFAPVPTAPGEEEVAVRIETRLLSYKGSMLAEVTMEQKTARVTVPRGCRDDCLSSPLRAVIHDPLRQLGEAVRVAVQSR